MPIPIAVGKTETKPRLFIVVLLYFDTAELLVLATISFHYIAKASDKGWDYTVKSKPKNDQDSTDRVYNLAELPDNFSD
jgi:hypothetical protein